MIKRDTKVRFVAGSRLRAIKDKQLLQSGMNEGIEIGEHKTGVVQHVLENNAFVVLVENEWYGWVYNYELYEI